MTKKRKASKAEQREEAEMAAVAEKYGLDPVADFLAELVKQSWRTMDTAPKDPETYVLLFCLEDKSRWFASWQGGRWFGVDDMGLRREGHTEGDPEVVTGWAVNAWMPLPDPPYVEAAVR